MAKNILRRQFSNTYGKNKPYQNSEPLQETSKLPSIDPPNITVTAVIIYTILLALFIFIYLNRNEAYEIIQRMYNDFKPSNKIDEIEERYHKLFKDYTDTSMNTSKKIDELIEHGNHNRDTIESVEKQLMERDKRYMASLSARDKRNLSLLDARDKRRMESLESLEKRRMESLETREKRIIELLEKSQTCNSLEKKEKEIKELEKREENGGVKKLEEKISGYTKEQTVNSNGFCYIGYDKNVRECTHVSQGDICMSGQVFPSMDVCQYPKFIDESFRRGR